MGLTLLVSVRGLSVTAVLNLVAAECSADLEPETPGCPPSPLSRKGVGSGAGHQEKQLSEGKAVMLKFLPQNYRPHLSVCYHLRISVL